VLKALPRYVYVKNIIDENWSEWARGKVYFASNKK